MKDIDKGDVPLGLYCCSSQQKSPLWGVRYVHIAMPDADENVEIAPSPNVLITSGEVEQ